MLPLLFQVMVLFLYFTTTCLTSNMHDSFSFFRSSDALSTRQDTKDASSTRQTSVLVVVLETGEVYIISSLSTRQDTQVLYIDPTTGSLCHFGKVGQDVFNSKEEAFDYITNGSRQCNSATIGCAIIGYSVLGSIGLLLVATKHNPTVPDLPGGGCVHTVVKSQWIKLQLQKPSLRERVKQKLFWS
jgi:hypothetical protein